jgi:predicted porin
MKKSLLALAVLGAFAGVASAQSSVTIYGIVDTGIAHIDNGGDTVNALRTGNNNSSRIGFKGVEDLGNGLKATFVLENGIESDTGAQSTDASAAFSRLSYVGLEGGFGAVRLGKQNTQIKTALSQIDPFETGGIVNAINLFGGNQGGATPERVANQITYTMPNLSGFNGSIGYTFGETAGDNSANEAWGGQFGYTNGPLNVQFGYNDQNSNGNLINELDQKIAMIGATYDFGVVKLHAAYQQKKIDNENPNTTTRLDFKVKSALVGVTVPFGASKIRAEYIRNDDDRTNFDNNVFAVSYTYSLSKRTTLYTTYVRADNDNSSNLNFATGAPVVVGENTSGFAVGVQHNF